MADLQGIAKAATGIAGLDGITDGGLPRGRPTLVAGGPGSGKTTLGMEFLVRGVTEFGEPGVFVAFEERPADLVANFASMGFDLQQMIADHQLALDFVYVERSEIEETGEYDLDGLFVRLAYAVESVGAQRIVLDTIESLFSGFTNENILRAELRRLFRWLKERGLTAVITGEQGEKTLTRQGLEEYVSDCVIFLDHRVTGQVSTRRLRVVKYRGSAHGTNEYPFVVGRQGISVLPIASLTLQHEASSEHVTTGIPELDEMMAGGYYRGSSILVTGSAGTGKSSVAAHFAAAACARGERCLYFAFEESPHQIVRNMSSIGLDLQGCLDSGVLRIEATRPTYHGLEAHLMSVADLVAAWDASVVIFDPISNLIAVGNEQEVKSMLTRVIDHFKVHQITALCTSLTSEEPVPGTDFGVSSLMDVWLQLTAMEYAGERNRGLSIIKSRGMSHSNQIREFVLTDEGVKLLQPYVGPGEVLMGSSRVAQEARDELARKLREDQIASTERELQRKQSYVEAQIEALQAQHASEREQTQRDLLREQMTERLTAEARQQMMQRRHGQSEPESKSDTDEGNP